jgi:hypothetical protein
LARQNGKLSASGSIRLEYSIASSSMALSKPNSLYAITRFAYSQRFGLLGCGV